MTDASPFRSVVLLSPAHPLRGGIASSSQRLARELQQAGYEVTLYSFRLQYPDFLFPGKTQYTDDPPPPGLDIVTRINAVNPLNWWAVGRELARRRPDLLVVRFWLPVLAPALGTICRLARRNRHTRVIAIADNITPHEARPGDRLLTRYFAASVDGFIALSRAVADEVRQFSPRHPADYVPPPVSDNSGPQVRREEALVHLGLPADRRYLLFFGFVRRYKGLDLLLHALADERLRDRNLFLLVAGEFYEAEESYRALVEALHLGDRVRFDADYIPAEEVKYYFGAADLVVQPYRTATQSGISQLAYHFERPMVVTRVGGLPEFVEHGRAGYVVDVDAAAVATAIDDFFRHDRRAAMTAGVRAGKKRFSWRRLVEGLEEMYAKL